MTQHYFPFELLSIWELSLLDTVDSEPVSRGTIQNIRSPSVTLNVSLVGQQSQKRISARALLNSGAEGMIINHSFAQKHNLTLHTLCSSLNIQNVNGSLNHSGPIHFIIIQTLWISTHNNQLHQEHSEFYVTSLATHDIILDTDWLKAHNLELIWTNSQITFFRCLAACTLTSKPLVIWSTNHTAPAIYISTLDLSLTVILGSNYEQLATPYFLLQYQLLKNPKP